MGIEPKEGNFLSEKREGERERLRYRTEIDGRNRNIDGRDREIAGRNKKTELTIKIPSKAG